MTPIKKGHVMQREVELGSLVVEIEGLWHNPRSFTGLGKVPIGELAEDIKHRGVKDPLTVQRVRVSGRDDVLELVLDGQRRAISLPKAGYSKSDRIPVVDFTDEIIELDEKSSAKLLVDVLAMGTFREGLSSFEQAEAAEQLRKAGRSLAEIGKAIKRSDSWVSRMLKARSSASSELLDAWMAGKLTDEQFKDLSEVKKATQSDAITEIVNTKAAPVTNGVNGHSTSRAAKTEARARTKELAAKAKAKAEKPTEKATKAKTKAKSAQHPPSRASLAELVALADVIVPNEYSRGVVDGVKYALGTISEEKFAKPWKQFLKLVAVKASRNEEKASKK